MQFAIDADESNEDDRAGHVVQTLDPTPEYVPAKHGEHALELVAAVTPEDVPAGQFRQNVALLAPVRFEYVPAKQFVHTVAKGTANFPASHTTHAPLTVMEPAPHGHTYVSK